MLMKTCGNIAKKANATNEIQIKLHNDAIQQNLHIIMSCHANNTRDETLFTTFIHSNIHYADVHCNNRRLTISLHSVTSLQRCYRNRRVQHTAK